MQEFHLLELYICRPRGVPLVYETFSWQHGVFTAACLKSEVCFEGGTKKEIFHDPMAMRNYLSYNFGEYLQHWLGLEKSGRKVGNVRHFASSYCTSPNFPVALLVYRCRSRAGEGGMNLY